MVRENVERKDEDCKEEARKARMRMVRKTLRKRMRMVRKSIYRKERTKMVRKSVGKKG
jgi:signal transduction histidine kinase